MSDNEEDQRQQQSGDGEPAAPELDRIPRQSFFELLPRRSLMKAALLLLFLIFIVVFKGRATSVVKQITDVVMPPPAGSEAPPPVRLAPPKDKQR